MSTTKLRTPQARVLRALVPADPATPQFEWPLLDRAALGVRAGYTPISGSVSRALAGIHAGNRTSGAPHLGLIPLGLVEEVRLDVDGLTELCYRATEAGVRAYQSFVSGGGKLPPLKPASVCTNKRYVK